MKSFVTQLAFRSCAISLLAGLASAVPLPWTNTEGKTIQAEFARLEGESVVVRKDGKEIPIALGKLSLASRNQARELAAKTPVNAEKPADQVLSAKSFGKQEDPEHQRKLAVSILEKKGQVEVWRGSGHVVINDVKNLPVGKLELKSVYAIGSPFTDEDAVLLNGCKELTNLRLHRASVEALPLGSLVALELLEFYQSNVSLSVLAPLRGHKNLRDFALWHSTTPIGKGVIPIVASMPNLEVLTLHKAGIEGDALNPLVKLKFLKILKLGGNQCTDDDLLELTNLPALESLNLSESDLMNHTLAFLPKIKNLKSIDLANCQLAEHTMDVLAQVPSLASIQLYNVSLTDEMLRPLGGHRSLRELFIDETAITGEGFAAMKPIPNLEMLKLAGNKPRPGDAMIASLPLFSPNLKILYVNASQFGASGYQSLAGLKKVTILDLQNAANLDEAVVLGIANMKSLTNLGLPRSNLNNSLLSALEPAKSRLIELHIQDTRVGDDSIAMLEKFRFLTALNITGTDISRDGAERLRKALPACNVIY